MPGPRDYYVGTPTMSGPLLLHVGTPRLSYGDPDLLCEGRDDYVWAPIYHVGVPTYYVGAPGIM